MKRLGERIKLKRQSLNMQMNELARMVGISSSALSQIEKAKAFPSVVTLKAIADNLHTTVGELIGENEILTNFPLVTFDEKTYTEKNQSGATLYHLSNPGIGKLMDTFLIEFEQGSDAEDIMKHHAGQEYIFVLKGKLEISLDEKLYILEKNDSFYYNSSRPHAIKNIFKGISQIVWVVTPPELR